MIYFFYFLWKDDQDEADTWEQLERVDEVGRHHNITKSYFSCNWE